MAGKSIGPASPGCPARWLCCLCAPSSPPGLLASVCPAAPPDFELADGANQYRIGYFAAAHRTGDVHFPFPDNVEPAFQLVTVRQSYTNLPADPVARVFGIFFIPPLLARLFLDSDRLHGFSRQRRLNHFNGGQVDRKSTRLNSSHVRISYAVFCLKK